MTYLIYIFSDYISIVHQNSRFRLHTLRPNSFGIFGVIFQPRPPENKKKRKGKEKRSEKKEIELLNHSVENVNDSGQISWTYFMEKTFRKEDTFKTQIGYEMPGASRLQTHKLAWSEDKELRLIHAQNSEYFETLW